MVCLAVLCCNTACIHWRYGVKDPAAHLAFLTSLLSRINKTKYSEAYVLLLSTSAHAKLLYGDLLGTKADMDEAGKVWHKQLHYLSCVDTRHRSLTTWTVLTHPSMRRITA